MVIKTYVKIKLILLTKLIMAFNNSVKKRAIRYILLVLVWLALPVKSKAQQNSDLLILKNGTELTGKIDSILRDTVFFSVNGSIRINVAMNNVSKITTSNEGNGGIVYGKSPKKLYKSRYTRTDTLKHNRLLNTAVAGRGIATGIGYGYKINTILMPVAEVTYFRMFTPGGRFISTQAGITGCLTKRRISPYYHFTYGYGFNLTNNEIWLEEPLISKKGGERFEIGLGLNQAIRDANASWSVGFHFMRQNAVYRYNGTIWDWRTGTSQQVDITEYLGYNRFCLRFGVNF